jgi:hypothetical protein
VAVPTDRLDFQSSFFDPVQEPELATAIDPPVTVTKTPVTNNLKGRNQGNWGEILTRLYFIVYGGFWNADTCEFVTRWVALQAPSTTGDLTNFRPMTTHPEDYPITREEAVRSLLDCEQALMQKVTEAPKHAFDVPEITALCKTIGLSRSGSPNSVKDDVRLMRANGTPELLFCENVGASKASIVNASKKIRFVFLVVRANGSIITTEERTDLLMRFTREGTSGCKSAVQLLYAEGYRLVHLRSEDAQFKQCIDKFEKTLVNLCLLYLRTPGVAEFEAIWELYREGLNSSPIQADERVTAETECSLFVDYCYRCIFYGGPRQRVKIKRTMSAGKATGMIFFDGRRDEHKYLLYCGTDQEWWSSQIIRALTVDTPSRAIRRHNYGFMYEEANRLQFDYAVGMRGSFANLTRPSTP